MWAVSYFAQQSAMNSQFAEPFVKSLVGSLDAVTELMAHLLYHRKGKKLIQHSTTTDLQITRPK